MNQVYKWTIPAGIGIPLASAMTAILVTTGGIDAPSQLVIYLTIAYAIPFFGLWLVVRHNRRQTDVRSALADKCAAIATLAVMLVAASAGSVALELGVRQGGPGASTNAIAVVVMPVFLTAVGVAVYLVTWLASRLVADARRRRAE